MYTVCWTDDNGDHWERLSTRDDVVKLIRTHNLQDDADVLIFTPEADDSTIEVDEIFYPDMEGEA